MSEELKPSVAGLPITMVIPLGIKTINLTFWMRPFEVETHFKKFKINSPYSALYLQMVKGYDPNLSKDDFSSLSFPISDYNLMDIKNVFEIAISWFSDENKKLLYGVNDSGMLLFNNEYKELKAMFTNEFSAVKTSIKIVPSIYEDAYNQYSPAAILFINKADNYILLREYELRKLANFIINFNFISYSQFAMQCMSHCANMGSLLTYEETKKRMAQQRQFDSNFRY